MSVCVALLRCSSSSSPPFPSRVSSLHTDAACEIFFVISSTLHVVSVCAFAVLFQPFSLPFPPLLVLSSSSLHEMTTTAFTSSLFYPLIPSSPARDVSVTLLD